MEEFGALPLVVPFGGWSRALSKQFAEDFEQECSPFQYALSTRAGTGVVIFSVDGIRAYDHVLRAAMLGRLERVPRTSAILPFARLSYAQPSTEKEEHKVVTKQRVANRVTH